MPNFSKTRCQGVGFFAKSIVLTLLLSQQYVVIATSSSHTLINYRWKTRRLLPHGESARQSIAFGLPSVVVRATVWNSSRMVASMQSGTVDKKWFIAKLDERRQSVRGLARHMDIDASAVSRIFSGQRKMQLDEAHTIARFLNAPVQEVMRHAGVAKDLDGLPTRILLAATINSKGEVLRLKEPKPLPQSVIDRASSAISGKGNGRVIAAQIRASSGPLAMWDDAVILFDPTDRVDSDAIGSLAICRKMDGNQILVRVERARKTGEATVRTPADDQTDVTLETASPVIAVIP